MYVIDRGTESGEGETGFIHVAYVFASRDTGGLRRVYPCVCGCGREKERAFCVFALLTCVRVSERHGCVCVCVCRAVCVCAGGWGGSGLGSFLVRKSFFDEQVFNFTPRCVHSPQGSSSVAATAGGGWMQQ